CLVGAVGEVARPVGEVTRPVVEVGGAVGELPGAVGGVGEARVQVVEAGVEAVEVLLGHLPAHGGGGGLGDRGAHQGVDLAARIVGGDLEDRLGRLGGADGGQVRREVLRDHHDRGVGAVTQPLLGVVLAGQLPV